MSYQNLFVPKVRKITIEDEGEKADFYIRKPKAIEMIQRGSAMEKKKAKGETEDSEAINRELIGKYVVNKDGSAITAEDVDGILSMESTAFTKFTEMLTEMISGKKAEAEAKNA